MGKMMETDNTLAEDLIDRKYWDIRHLDNGFYRVETRMCYDKETCERIINLANQINAPYCMEVIQSIYDEIRMGHEEYSKLPGVLQRRQELIKRIKK